MQFLWIYGVLFLLLVIYCIFGALIDRVLKIRGNVSLYPVIGYIFTSLCFQVVSIPMQLLKCSLSLTTYVYLAVLALWLLCFGWIAKKNPVEKEKIVCSDFLVLAVIIVIQWALLLYNMCYGSTWDTSQYIGQISTAVYTNTMNQYEPYSGKMISSFNWKDCFVVYEMHSAAICRLLHIHPLIFFHRILANIEITLVSVIYYNIAMLLFRQDKKKANTTLILMTVLNLFSYSLFTWSGFLFIRTAESKSMLANVILPLLLLWVIYIVKEKDNRIYILLFGTAAMGLGISKSGAFVIPAALVLYSIPVFRRDSFWGTVLRLSACFAPCILYVFIYLVPLSSA